MKTHAARSRARAWVLQLLYAWEISGDPSLIDFADRALERRRLSGRYRPHVRRLLKVLQAERERIDALLQSHIPNWRLERLSALDRNILRIGVAELCFVDEVPGKVAINEAIRLAERYGGAESPGFVNGVLDAVYREAAVAG